MPIFRSLLDKAQNDLSKAQRRVFTKYADSAPPDHVAQSRALDDYLGETPEQPPVTPPEPVTPEALAARQRQSQAGVLQRDQLARQEFEDAARRAAPATRPFTFAEDVAKPIGEAFSKLNEPPETLGKVAGVPIQDPYATEKRILGIGQEVFRPAAELGGGLISASGLRTTELAGRNFADQLGIQPGDDVGTILGKVRDYQRTRPEAERFITENLALLALDPAFRAAGPALRAFGRGGKATGRTLGEVHASEAGSLTFGMSKAQMESRLAQLNEQIGKGTVNPEAIDSVNYEIRQLQNALGANKSAFTYPVPVRRGETGATPFEPTPGQYQYNKDIPQVPRTATREHINERATQAGFDEAGRPVEIPFEQKVRQELLPQAPTPEQLKMGIEPGFYIPQGLTTADEAALRTAYKAGNKRVIRNILAKGQCQLLE